MLIFQDEINVRIKCVKMRIKAVYIKVIINNKILIKSFKLIFK